MINQGMYNLKKPKALRGSRKEQIQRQTAKIDREINNLVYKLYGITEDEREIFEGVK